MNYRRKIKAASVEQTIKVHVDHIATELKDLLAESSPAEKTVIVSILVDKMLAKITTSGSERAEVIKGLKNRLL